MRLKNIKITDASLQMRTDIERKNYKQILFDSALNNFQNSKNNE